MDITEVLIAPRSPWQNPYVERVTASIRRECLDHLIIINERHLHGVLSAYADYYHRTRTHLSLRKDCPDPRPVHPPTRGKVIAIPQVGVCTIAMNASPLERIYNGLLIVAQRPVRCRLHSSY
jgi:putative transposase